VIGGTFDPIHYGHLAAAEEARVDRPGPSYTVDTISILQEQLGQETEMFFIMGIDSLAELPTWHQPQALIQLCRLVAVRRPGFEIDLAELERSVPRITPRVDIIDMPEVDISSSELQQRVRDGLPIKYQVPEEVERYIMEHGLYRQSAGSAN